MTVRWTMGPTVVLMVVMVPFTLGEYRTPRVGTPLADEPCWMVNHWVGYYSNRPTTTTLAGGYLFVRDVDDYMAVGIVKAEATYTKPGQPTLYVFQIVSAFSSVSHYCEPCPPWQQCAEEGVIEPR